MVVVYSRIQTVQDLPSEHEYERDNWSSSYNDTENLSEAKIHILTENGQDCVVIEHKRFVKGKAVLEGDKDKPSDDNKDNDDEFRRVVNDLASKQFIRVSDKKLQVFVVVRYPENYNPLLPLSLQRKLDAMSPREFLTYVLEELSLEERESLMVDERQRRRTFQVDWPYQNNLSGVKMAQAGLFYVGANDRVQCVFCRGSLWRWDADDVPMLEHSRMFAFCRFVKGLNCGNREYRSDKLEGDDLRNITRFSSDYQEPPGRRGVLSVDSSTLGVSTLRAAHIEYAPEASRLRTYNRWPDSNALTKEELCAAGYYYTGFDDQVRCFFCSIGLREWSVTDNPSEEHARWYPDCAFLLQQKGQDYVDEVRARTPANKKSVQQTRAQARREAAEIETQSDQERMYEICQDLGYGNDQMAAAIQHHGGPFENVKELLDVIGKIEDGELVVSEHLSGREEVQRPREAAVEPARRERNTHYKQGCKRCEQRTGRYKPADHVSLPCGHLSLCESCNAEELAKLDRGVGAYTPRCVTCDALLTGTIKAFLG